MMGQRPAGGRDRGVLAIVLDLRQGFSEPQTKER